MPHIVVHYSKPLESTVNISDLLKALHHDLSTRETALLGDIKTYAMPLTFSLVGEDDKNNEMIHVILKLLPGRSVSLKKEMIEGLRDVVRNHVSTVAVMAEVQELELETYCK